MFSYRGSRFVASAVVLFWAVWSLALLRALEAPAMVKDLRPAVVKAADDNGGEDPNEIEIEPDPPTPLITEGTP